MITTTTWIVWSVRPPENLEKISCSSMIDAAKGWADRQFRRGILPRDGTEVFARCESDTMPKQSTYRLRISIIAAPAFRATFTGLAFEGVHGEPKEAGRG